MKIFTTCVKKLLKKKERDIDFFGKFDVALTQFTTILIDNIAS